MWAPQTNDYEKIMDMFLLFFLVRSTCFNVTKAFPVDAENRFKKVVVQKASLNDCPNHFRWKTIFLGGST